ncbi:MAG: methylglyoxal synthase [Desulfitobacteriaceae bacterium]
MNIALIAHNDKKDELIEFVRKHQEFFRGQNLLATGTTGRRVTDATGLKVACLASGPLGGDQQIGSKIVNGEVDLVLFFRDPLTAQPHEPDINALIRICDVHTIPVATNIGTAKLALKALEG